jgi:hypothetical protein
MLTLSAHAKNVDVSGRIPAFWGLFACTAALSVLVFCAYAPMVAESFAGASSRRVAHRRFVVDLSRSSNCVAGMRSLLLAVRH